MLRKILSIGLLIAGAGAVNAQDFTVEFDTTTAGTVGTAPSTEEGYTDDFVTLSNHLENVSSEVYKFRWNLILPTSMPDGWILQGYCDNKLCRPMGGIWTTGSEEESDDVSVGGNSVLKLQWCAPSDKADGIGVAKFKIFTRSQVDTVTYILEKQPSGLNAIAINDERVGIYPNPAEDRAIVYADKSLNAQQISVINMLGRQVLLQTIPAGTEASPISLSSLASGTYMVRVIDNKNNVITSRKLTKK